MTPVEMAAAIMALVTPYLAELGKSVAKKAGEATWAKTAVLYHSIKERFAQEKESDFQQALQKYEEQPESRGGGFQDMLVQLLKKDPEFAVLQSRLLREAQAAQPATFTTLVSGGEVGEIFNIDTMTGNLTISKGTAAESSRESGMSGSAAKYDAYPELRQNLTNHFNISELRSLCHDLGVDYENLASDTKEDLARELVRYCERHGRIPDLIATCQKLRPLVHTWEI